ncbi:MAG TPA: type II toxin-antitoxin system prevent-host-death family antitoxin [Burkholderiales bacterium]|nr:type II toxin-antitoxin system prevent-host-death family antitoxin [Burkholderiales bacterium]
MREIGAYEAKTHLPKLLEQVEKGERFIITRHGRAVAELAPVGHRSESDVRRAIKDLRSLRDELERRGVRMNDLLQEGETVRDLAHEAHRY